MIPGPYRLRDYRVRSRSVATNKCPEGAYRGVGLPVSAFVHERLMDLLAGELGLDRAEIRRRNLIRRAELPYDDGDQPALRQRRLPRGARARRSRRSATRASRERRRRRAPTAVCSASGSSCYVEYTGINSRVFTGRGMVGIAGYDGGPRRARRPARATVWTTLPAIGQGVETTFAQLPPTRSGSTSRTSPSRAPTPRSATCTAPEPFASRSAIAGGGAIRDACAELRRRLLEDAGERLEADPGDLEIVGGEVRVAGSPASRVPVAELVAAAADATRYRVSATFDPPAIAYPYATHACVVEVDAETGRDRRHCAT